VSDAAVRLAYLGKIVVDKSDVKRGTVLTTWQ
jgi:hypothetical protein